MPDSIDSLRHQLLQAVAPGFRDRLLDKGQARGLIWRDGELPPEAPAFPESLSEDLLDYAHALLAIALRLRSISASEESLNVAFLKSGEAIEAAVHRGKWDLDHGFHRVSAAVAFHLAGYAARAYTVLPQGRETMNLAPTEGALVGLLRRRLDEMYGNARAWLLDERHTDTWMAARLTDAADFDESDVISDVLTTSFMRGIALFGSALRTGESQSATAAWRQFTETAEGAGELHSVNHWWTATLASHLVDDLWRVSLHEQLPLLPPEHPDYDRWRVIRRDYIQRLRAGTHSAIELWPSQLDAARRAVDSEDDLVVALPTGAGKTRIAELGILRALAAERRVIYLTPLRALSAQVERDLAVTFVPLGATVSSLYGSAGVERSDAEDLRDSRIVVTTPEKLDFALRNDGSVLADVGLIVLDEGHMLGPNEREVRYEALIQTLLRQPDASGRRLISLSALFPTPSEMEDLVAWIRQDAPGGPVHSTWRPTRQRFGVLQWVRSAARLEVKAEEESAFVPRFIEPHSAPVGSRRRKSFPSDKNELTLAAAWRFVGQRMDTLIFCPMRKSVESMGSLVLKCIQQEVLPPLRDPGISIREAMATGIEWLGPDHPAVRCLQHGVALHHGGLPRPFLDAVERLLRNRDCPVTIASPTLAQGLNFSASVVLFPSIWRNRAVIPAAEFANVAGRAGRAFVDAEAQVLHVIWEDAPRRTQNALRNWSDLVARAKAPQVESGILLLALKLCHRIALATGIPVAEVVEYVTGHGDAWDFSKARGALTGTAEAEWERDLASLDSAILAILKAETADPEIEGALNGALEGSLFSRQIARKTEEVQGLVRGLVNARAKLIWAQAHVDRRRGYHAAGIGLAAGSFLDSNLPRLISLLIATEAAMAEGDFEVGAAAVVEFAGNVLGTAPFRPPRPMPSGWQEALRLWMLEEPTVDVMACCGDEGVDFLQEALVYRLPWAMEAVRVHAVAVGEKQADQLQGIAPLAVEAGSFRRSVITLSRSGLASRQGAIAAVRTTGATFENGGGMRLWLNSAEVRAADAAPDWPTPQSRHAWREFFERQITGARQKWTRDTQQIRVNWIQEAPASDTDVILEPAAENTNGLVLLPHFEKVGTLLSPMHRPPQHVVAARVDPSREGVLVEYFGPP